MNNKARYFKLAVFAVVLGLGVAEFYREYKPTITAKQEAVPTPSAQKAEGKQETQPEKEEFIWISPKGIASLSVTVIFLITAFVLWRKIRQLTPSPVQKRGRPGPNPASTASTPAVPTATPATPVVPAAANSNPSGDHVFNFTGGFLIGLAALLFVGASIFFYWQSGAMDKNNAENDGSDAARNRAAERLNAEAANYEFTEAQVPAELAAPEIAYCESRNRQFEDDGKTPLKTRGRNDDGSPGDAFGKYQFREAHRSIALDLGFDLNTEIGQDGYFPITWKDQGSKPWLATKGCWYPHLQAIAEQRGTRPAGIPGQRHLKYLETTKDWSQPETVLSSPGFQIHWESMGGKPYCVRVNKNDKFKFCSTKEEPLVEIPPEKVKEIRWAESLEFKSEEGAKIRLFLSPS